MKQIRIDGYDISYIEIGKGPTIVCVHGSISDFRTWSSVLGPLSRRHRVIVPSLRHFFPEHWDGTGGGFTMAQHVADMVSFLEAVGDGPVDLVGHSRGGHIAFRIAHRRGDLVRRLVLAEPGGELEPSLLPPDAPAAPAGRTRTADAAMLIRAGDIDGGMALFVDGIEGPGGWRHLAAARRQRLRDNAATLLGQVDEGRQPYRRAEAEAITVPTLFVGGEKTPGMLPVVLRTLAGIVPGARTAIIPNATHSMFEQEPELFCDAVLAFLEE